MRAFIVRPFGKKAVPPRGTDPGSPVPRKEVDFDAVERELIGPALDALGVLGRTTAEMVRPGNIRVDIYRGLLAADLVVADISLGNPNVFYELGVRHALRGRRTFLLRADLADLPFDLQTDRYFSYDAEKPARRLEDLVSALRQTIDSDETDSPVFHSLPLLREADSRTLAVVPPDFREEVARARSSNRPGDLALLAAEARGFDWEREGLRTVGLSQVDINAYGGARDTWELVRAYDERDIEANERLATIYHRLGDATRSDQAVDRGLSHPALDPAHRSRLLNLKARNTRARWRQSWLEADDPRSAALASSLLLESLEQYLQAFREDLNGYYSALRALELATVAVELAQALPEVWAVRVGPDAAARELARLIDLQARLRVVTGVSMDARRERYLAAPSEHPYYFGDRARFAGMEAEDPRQAALAVKDAVAHSANRQPGGLREHFSDLARLGVRPEHVAAALEACGHAGAEEPGLRRVIVFAGHAIDEEGRAPARFPAEMVKEAKEAIEQAVREELDLSLDPNAFGLPGPATPIGSGVLAMAGGSSGGDLLFHEACAELGLTTEMYLAIPRVGYVPELNLKRGRDWNACFDRIYQNPAIQRRILNESESLPRWLRGKTGYNIWARFFRWMLYNAIAAAPERVTLIVLWNTERGMVADIVSEADRLGVKVRIIDTRAVFRSAAASGA
jgi:hypothetical protein